MFDFLKIQKPGYFPKNCVMSLVIYGSLRGMLLLEFSHWSLWRLGQAFPTRAWTVTFVYRIFAYVCTEVSSIIGKIWGAGRVNEIGASVQRKISS